MNLNRRKRGSDDVTVMQQWLCEGSAKEHPNQEIAWKYQNLINNCQTNEDSAYFETASSNKCSLPIQRENFGVPLCSYDPNLPYSGFNCSIASKYGSSMLRHNGNDNYNSQFFQKSSQDNFRGFTVTVGSDGKVIASPENSKQPYDEVASPEQISSITTCSIADCCSDKTPFQEDTSALSSVHFSKHKLRQELLPRHGLQALTSEHYRLQSRPPCSLAHVEISLGSQMYGCGIKRRKLHNEVLVGRSSKPSQLSFEQLCSYEEKRFSRDQAPRNKDPTAFMQNILVWYLKFRSNPVGHERMQQEFLNQLHRSLCNVQICDCKKYCALIAHFDGCRNTSCKLCQPVRLLGNTMNITSVPPFEPCHIKKITSDSEKPNGYVSRDVHARDYIVQDMKRPPKQMKMDSAAEVDNFSLFPEVDEYSLFAVVRPFLKQEGGLNDEDSKEKTNKEPLSSKEISTTIVTGNATADTDGGSMWSGKFDELSDLEQSSESHINSALNQVPISIDNNGNFIQTVSGAVDLCNIKLRTDDAISHSEEHNSVDKRWDMGLVKITKWKSDANFCSPRSNSEGTRVLSQIGDLRKSCQNFNDVRGLDSINLGKDYAISLSEGCNLVGEQQDIFCNETRKGKNDVTFSCQRLNSDGISVHPQASPTDEGENFKPVTGSEHSMIDAKYDLANPDNQGGRKLNDLRTSGVSLIDNFTADQIREHLHSINEDINLESCSSMSAYTIGSNTCQLCALDTIMFTALDMFCTSCEARIKHKLTYYWTKDEAGVRYCFCTKCFKNARGGNISCRGRSFTKSQLHKGKNTEEAGELWVLCDKCQHWQHQICALYNSERDPKGEANYICPFCRLQEIEAKELVSITRADGAQDLPRTKLSDHIEQRLFRSLQQERKQRAELLGKNPEDVPGVSDLKVRVVLNANKQLRVKQQFLDILHDETYPAEFPYKSKAILLFQKVDGADVCLFALYVQEFGSECENPNKRSVYISYLDSVKYFSPEIKTVVGVPLRTFVYHEILIGYLDYCKKLGFLTCHIWSCPPLKGEDFILHCHPETQKRPNPIKLVHWYKKMLRKAKEENVVVGITNLYDYFFVPNEDSNCKITAARLPYFDGHYCSRAVVDILQSIEDSGGKSDKQVKNQLTRRTVKAMGHNDLSTDATKDILVMQKLGQKILPVKDEFIVIHLQFTCTKCREAILSGSCWSCNQCTKFHLCGRCHELELSTHTAIYGDKHQLYKTQVDIAADTDDKDALIENDFFIDRQTFLSFCERNYFRFNTLRRAKHSSMMILHHLHASKETAAKTICSVCNQNVVDGYRCETCSRVYVCNACHLKEGEHCHVHELVKHSTKDDPMKKCELQRASEGDSRQESEHTQQQEPLSELEMYVNLLEHANQCPSTSHHPCMDPKCLNIKRMFSHTRECKRRLGGGCNLCKNTWLMLRMHSQKCKTSNCTVPRCMDINNHKKNESIKI